MDPQPILRTFLIADVRGYTRFTRERGDAAAARLAKKFADLARDAVEARRGRVLELRGDEALAVFENAAQAVRAAVELQAACAEESAEDPTLPLPVGIGIDAGEAIPVEDGYRGVALNMAARLCSNAAAGQVLVTRTIVDLADSIDRVTFQEKGPASFKGFEQPVDVIEAVSADGRAAPPMAPAPAAIALAAELDVITPIVAREFEMHWLRGTWRQARRGNGRVVFLSGPHGIGKTRLAAELAAEVDRAGHETRYAGAGGTAAALARAAVEAATAAERPTLVVLDDLEVTADTVTSLLAESFARIEGRPVLVIGIAGEPEGNPALTALIERADTRGDGHLRLTPLDAGGVREITEVYVGTDVAEAPIESMLRASGGVPGRVHEVVSEWARDEASRRLAAAAEWMAQGRTQRQANLEFANNVIGLKLGRLYGVAEGLQTTVEVCPFKGLASFEEQDAAYFFGRERLIGELAARTVHAGVLGVVGASGSGKSSAISAGLIPSLRAGLLPGSERWTAGPMRPGEHPVDALREALGGRDLQEAAAAISTGDRLVLVVDQFEELFTVCGDEAERAAFVDAITGVATRSPDRVVVVVALRGDFYGHCAAYPALAEAVAANHVLVGPMTPEELRRAIELPARRAGLRVEAALTQALIEEVTDEPGALPLLSTTLVELWQQRSDGWLRFEAYERTGGVRGAVARLADTAHEHLSELQRDAARNIFLRLTGPGEGDAVTRRRVPLAEFDLDRDEVTAVVLRRLTEDRLLTMDESSVEVAHEALLREWPLLRGWLDDDAQGRLLRQHLTHAANQWDASGREPSELYRGARLSAALDWSTEHGAELNDLERSFLAEGRAASEREAEKQRRTNRRLRGLLAGVAVFLIIAILAGVLAFVQRGNAKRSATVALSKSLAAQAVSIPQLDLAMVLAAQSLRLDQSVQTRSAVLSTLQRSPQATGVIYGGRSRTLSIALSPDETTLAMAQNSAEVLLRDAGTGKETAPPIRDFLEPVTFSPSGSLVRVRYDDEGHTLPVELVDPSNGAVTRTLPVPRVVSADPELGASSEVISPDGRRLMIGFSVLGPPAPAYVVQWDLATGRQIGPTMNVDGLAPRGVSFTRTGREIVAIGFNVTVFDAATGRARSVHPAPAEPHATAAAPDGRTVVTGDRDGNVTFVDVGTGRSAPGSGRHASAVQTIGFTPDGRKVITGGDDGLVQIWDVAGRTVVESLQGHAGRVLAQAVTKDGRTLYTGSLDGTVLVWDLSGERRFGRTFTAGPGAERPERRDSPESPNLALSPDGRRVAAGNADGTVTITDLSTFREVVRFKAAPDVVGAVDFSPDGKTLLVLEGRLTPDGLFMAASTPATWSLDPTPRRLRTFEGLPQTSWTSFTPDGRSVVASGYLFKESGPPSGFVARWDAATGRLVAEPTRLDILATFVSANRDGSLLAVGLDDTKAVLVDPVRRRVTRELDAGDRAPVLATAFSPDGRTVAVGPWDGFLRLFDIGTGRQIGKAVKASDGAITSIDWSPDGSTIATGGTDGSTRLFDAATQQWLGRPMPGVSNLAEFVAFTPDGANVVVASSTGAGFVWPATHQAWQDHACAVARRDFTQDEWTLYLGDRPYEKTCTG